MNKTSLRAAVRLGLIVLTLAACAPDTPDTPREAGEPQVVPLVETVVELDFAGASSGPRSTYGELQIARVPGTGQWLIAVDRELLLFDVDGAYARTIGRPGEGPGEHDRIRGLAFDQADSLLIADDGNRRIDVFAPDLTYARSIPLSAEVYHFDLLADGRGLIGAPFGRAPFDQHRALIVDRDGAATPVAEMPPLTDPQHRRFANSPFASDGDGFRIAQPFQYTVLRYESDGTLLDSIVGQPSWFVPADYSDERYRQLGIEMDRPSISGLMRDPEGRLWIQTLIPVTTDSLPDPAAMAADPAAMVRFIDSVIDLAIEAVDAGTGERLAAQV